MATRAEWLARPRDVAAEAAWRRLAPGSAATVTTCRAWPQGSLASFAAWHHAQGFARIYLYVDDAAEAPRARAEVAGTQAAAVVLACDGPLRAQWRELSQWARLGAHVEAEAQARQELNAEHAVGLALQAGDVAWLLHLDADEAFYTPRAGGAAAHFAALAAEGAVAMRYVNFEAVAERPDVRDAFREVTLFRRSTGAVPRGAAAREAHAFWTRRSPHGHYFEGYSNGKAAAAVMPGVLPESVHAWVPANPELLRGARHNWAHAEPPGTAGASMIAGDGPSRDACILHFNSAVGYEAWRTKYATLGSFADAWFAGQRPIPPSFHRDSRDVCGAGDDDAARAFYTRRAVLSDAEEVERQVASGLCVRILLVAAVTSGKDADEVALAEGTPVFA